MPTESLDQHRRQPLANALWLTRRSARPADVLTVGYETGILIDAFSGIVDRLTSVTWADVKHTRLPADDESVSLAVLETRIANEPPHPPPAEALSIVVKECHRMLAPDGTLMVVGENPLWFRRTPEAARRRVLKRRSRTLGDVGAGQWTRTMRRAGFSEVNLFLVTPAYSHPTHIIPATGRAAALHEAVLDPSPRATLRRAIARLGGRSLLYPGHLIVAEK